MFIVSSIGSFNCNFVMFWVFVFSGGSQSHKSGDYDDGSDHEGSEAVRKSSKKSSAEKVQPPVPVKLVPAPPPKVNVWEIRKSENQTPKTPLQPVSPASASTSSLSTGSKAEQTQPLSPTETVSEKLNDVSVNDEVNDNFSTHLISVWLLAKCI